jgi:endonuclease/exonuclease/phosphatase family metal-dependent hydrolase
VKNQTTRLALQALLVCTALVRGGRSVPVSVPAPAASGISVVSLNTAKETDAGRITRELRASPELGRADILLLQEVKQAAGEAQPSAVRVADELGLRVAYAPAASGVRDQGLAILSRYPLRDVRVIHLKPYDLRFHSRSRFALAATADSPWGPVRIVNAHLDTRLNGGERIEQLAPAVRESEAFSGPRIVGGDFNSNAFYWVARLLPVPAVHPQKQAIQNFMWRHGFTSALPANESTYDYLGLRLDWIWSHGLKAHASRVFPLDFSDHHAVWTRFSF